MSFNQNDIKTTTAHLCNKQKNYINNYPKRENIPVYDWQLDLAYNEDFAIWELEMNF